MLNLQSQQNWRRLWQLIATFAFLLFVSTTTAQAQITTFASFQQRSSSAQNFVFINNSGTNANFNSIGGGNPVFFLYDEAVIAGLPAELQFFQNATITLTSITTTPATTATGNFTQPINGTFTLQIIRDTAATVGANTRRNLLTVTVTQATSVGDIFGSNNSATYSASTPGQSVVYTSDFLDFSQTTARNFGLSFSSVTPALSLGAGNFLNSFTASGTGTFASNPPPFFQPPTAASVNIAGRVMNSTGRGISRARVSFVDGNGEIRTALTNVFGYYRFPGVEAGQTIVVSVASKRYVFNSQVVSVANELTDLNFTALN